MADKQETHELSLADLNKAIELNRRWCINKHKTKLPQAH